MKIKHFIMAILLTMSVGLISVARAEPVPGRTNDRVTVRSAVFDGTVEAKDREEFRKGINRLKDMVTNYKGIIDVRVRYLSDEVEPEKDAPHPYVTFDFYFASVADMDAALATSLRQETRDVIKSFSHLFKGRIYHFVREEEGVPLKK